MSRQLHLLIGLSLACLPLNACREADPLAALHAGEQGRVVRVIDGDALVLDTGQSVRLIGIEAPARPYKDRDGDAYHKESKRMLEDIALGRTVQLRYAGLTRDRYDRALAHVQTTDELGPPYWVNLEMIRRGGARVRVYPDTASANARLLVEEAEARAARRGLWSLDVYTIPNAAHLPPTFTRFQLVHATLDARISSDAPGASCAWSLKSAALTLTIKRDAAQLCQADAGAHILARGYVKDGQMEISHPLNLQLMSD